MVITPTNHTTSAFFGELEAEPSESMSLDEQSSIDSSQLMGTSTHTHTSSLLGGISAADASNHPNRRGADASSALASVVEETSASVAEDDSSRRRREDQPNSPSASDPIFDELRDQELIPTPQPMQRDVSTATGMTSTMHTSKSGFVTVPSRTLHTSNVDIATYKQMEEESDRYAAWAIHVVLGVFCGLVLISVLLTFVVVHKFGLVAMFGLLLLVCFAIFMIWFVDSLILSKDARFKPMRNKIVRVVEVAKQVVVDEFNLFQRDWNEHFLLTNGPCMDEENEEEEDTTYEGPNKNKRRSIVFRLIKPVFRLPRKIFRGRKGRSRSGKSRGQEKNYHPPAAENGVIG